jgi:SAM-dependent methyltransferase
MSQPIITPILEAGSREHILAWLCCPICREGLRWNETGSYGAPDLICPQGHRFPIEEGIARLDIKEPGRGGECRTARAFESRWKRFYPCGGYMSSRELFLDFIAPVTPEFFHGKDILDAGCGTGRFTRWAQEMGAGLVFGLDMSNSVRLSPSVPEDRKTPWYGVQADIHDAPFRRQFDYIMCLGVLHHLADPALGFQSLVRLLKPGGHVSVWVYGSENNGWILRWVDPLRVHVTSRLPAWLLDLICRPLGMILYAAAHAPDRSWLASLRKRLALDSYAANFLRRLSLREMMGIIYDHLVPPIAHYLPRQEIQGWFDANGIEIISMTSRNGNSWRVLGRKPI